MSRHDEELDALSRERLAAIVESSDDVIVGKTLDGIITSWNPGGERTFGWTTRTRAPIKIRGNGDRREGENSEEPARNSSSSPGGSPIEP